MATYKIFAHHKKNGKLFKVTDYAVAETREAAEKKFKSAYVNLKPVIDEVWKETAKGGWKALKK